MPKYPRPELVKCTCKSCNIKLLKAQIELAAVWTINENMARLGLGTEDFNEWWINHHKQLVSELERVKKL